MCQQPLLAAGKTGRVAGSKRAGSCRRRREEAATRRGSRDRGAGSVEVQASGGPRRRSPSRASNLVRRWQELGRFVGLGGNSNCADRHSRERLRPIPSWRQAGPCAIPDSTDEPEPLPEHDGHGDNVRHGAPAYLRPFHSLAACGRSAWRTSGRAPIPPRRPWPRAGTPLGSSSPWNSVCQSRKHRKVMWITGASAGGHRKIQAKPGFPAPSASLKTEIRSR